MSTIEKALQKKKALKKDTGADQVETNPQGQDDSTVIEKAVESNKAQSAPVTAAETEQAAPSAETEQAAPKETAPTPAAAAAKPVKTEGDRKPQMIPLSNTQEGFVNDQTRNVINEEFRAIKRKVLSNAFGPLSKTLQNSNLIMVTSPNPNEGKTFTAINLALSIALEQDKTVLLVDADVLRPSVMKTIGQPFENGLMEYLQGHVDDLSEIIHPTDLDTLRIIPAGKSHHLSTELLASQKMLETVAEFSTRYPDRVVIFDTPPLLGINETAILANLAGQAVIVVNEGKTSLTSLSQAVDHLNPDMAKGFVINKAKKSSTDGAGYYGYYYGSESE